MPYSIAVNLTFVFDTIVLFIYTLDMYKSAQIIILCSCVVLLLFSCASHIEQDILDETNVTVQLLKIREQTFLKRYKIAEKMYHRVQEDNGQNPSLYVEIEYEIAFLYVRQKKYKEAKPLLETLINRYEVDAGSDALPQWPYYLSKKILQDVVLPELEPRTFWDFVFPNRT